jgi:hypothetical protein
MQTTSRAVHQWIAGSLLWGAVGLSACTAAHPPGVARSHPEEIVPQASPYTPAELQAARQELASAQLALNASEYERACRLAAQAATDAQVADARAWTENGRLLAREVRVSSERLCRP